MLTLRKLSIAIIAIIVSAAMLMTFDSSSPVQAQAPGGPPVTLPGPNGRGGPQSPVPGIAPAGSGGPVLSAAVNAPRTTGLTAGVTVPGVGVTAGPAVSVTGVGVAGQAIPSVGATGLAAGMNAAQPHPATASQTLTGGVPSAARANAPISAGANVGLGASVNNSMNSQVQISRNAQGTNPSPGCTIGNGGPDNVCVGVTTSVASGVGCSAVATGVSTGPCGRCTRGPCSASVNTEGTVPGCLSDDHNANSQGFTGAGQSALQNPHCAATVPPVTVSTCPSGTTGTPPN